MKKIILLFGILCLCFNGCAKKEEKKNEKEWIIEFNKFPIYDEEPILTLKQVMMDDFMSPSQSYTRFSIVFTLKDLQKIKEILYSQPKLGEFFDNERWSYFYLEPTDEIDGLVKIGNKWRKKDSVIFYKEEEKNKYEKLRKEIEGKNKITKEGTL